MNRIIIYLISAFIAISGTWVANKIQLKKATKPLKKHIERLRLDSLVKAKELVILNDRFKFMVSSDSLKAAQIGELQTTMQVITKRDRAREAELNELRAWKADAEDGVITVHDTVRVGIFGKVKKKR